MAFKQTYDNTEEHALTISFACIFLTLSVYQKKWKISVLLLFKSKLLWKLSFDEESTKLRCDSKKTCGMVLATPSTSQTLELASDFKVCEFLFIKDAMKSLKLVSAIFYQFFIFSPNDGPLKTMTNVLYFI